MLNIFSDEYPSYTTLKNWIVSFKRGRFSVENEKRPGRPISVSTLENINAVYNMILADRRNGFKHIAETLEISYERVHHIIHVDLDMKKISAKWIPKCLNADQKRAWVEASRLICTLFEEDADFLSRVVTMVETWVHFYDPETKQQSMEWKHRGSLRPKKLRAQKSTGKVLVSVLWDIRGVIMIDC
jgi:histone-lysine N-methyltransferase SETMAR